MISIKNSYIFIHIPKTAGQSISGSLLNAEGKSWQTRNVDTSYLMRDGKVPEEGAKRLPHLMARQYVSCGHMSQEDFDSYFTFTFVRNPWDRMVSEYNWLKYSKRGMSLTDFLKKLPRNGWSDERLHAIPQYDFVTDENGNIIVDFIGRYENLKEDFDKVCETIGISTRLIKRNVSLKDSRPYWEYYDEESISLVNEMFSSDIEYFGYQFGK